MSVEEKRRGLEALGVLETALAALTRDRPAAFQARISLN